MIRARPVALAAFLMIACLVSSEELVLMLIALAVHEGAHILCARAAGLKVEHMELTPFGGVMRINGLWLLPARRLVPVALAGPAANLLLSAACVAAVWLSPTIAGYAEGAILINIWMCLINLLPALPLDGGRALFSLIRVRIAFERALTVCVWAAVIVSALLTIIGVLYIALMNKLNPAPFFMAGYIGFSVRREAREARHASLSAVFSSDSAPLAPADVRMHAASERANAADIVRAFRPDAINITLALRDGGAISAIVGQREMIDRAANGKPVGGERMA